jgi:hypothetical protein
MTFKLGAVLAIALLTSPAILQGQGQGQRGGPPPTPKADAPIDLTGYWVSVITEDWHVRMLTAPRGDFGSGSNTEGLPFGGGGNIPYNTEGTALGKAWDPAKDEAERNFCKAYGAGGVMRQPGRLHITWEDDYTLKFEMSAGTQTRFFRFARPAQTGQPVTQPSAAGAPSLQGNSTAQWISLGGRGDWARGGNLKVVTTGLRPGYYWKNGMPYSDKTTITEHYRVTKEPNGDVWLNMSLMSEDPTYLTQPWISTYHFKKEPDGSRWNATPCSIK